jgi:hypothetical protein
MPVDVMLRELSAPFELTVPLEVIGPLEVELP